MGVVEKEDFQQAIPSGLSSPELLAHQHKPFCSYYPTQIPTNNIIYYKNTLSKNRMGNLSHKKMLKIEKTPKTIVHGTNQKTVKKLISLKLHN